MNSPFNAGGAGSISAQETKIPHASCPKKQNRKWKQNWNKFNKDFTNSPHQKNKIIKNLKKIKTIFTIAVFTMMVFGKLLFIYTELLFVNLMGWMNEKYYICKVLLYSTFSRVKSYKWELTRFKIPLYSVKTQVDFDMSLTFDKTYNLKCC